MIRILKNRRALSTVVTTLIILVVSILLASVLTYFAINVVSTRVQEESLHVYNQHIWVDQTTGNAIGAITITNTGGRDVVISKITVRGQECTALFANPAQDPDVDIAYAVPPPASYVAVAAGTSIVLPSGNTVGVMITSPDSIGINDIGLTVGIGVHSAQAVYCSETNIQAHP
jgi:hypothetical protein